MCSNRMFSNMALLAVSRKVPCQNLYMHTNNHRADMNKKTWKYYCLSFFLSRSNSRKLDLQLIFTSRTATLATHHNVDVMSSLVNFEQKYSRSLYHVSYIPF